VPVKTKWLDRSILTFEMKIPYRKHADQKKSRSHHSTVLFSMPVLWFSVDSSSPLRAARAVSGWAIACCRPLAGWLPWGFHGMSK
jgi:hypothetical protein